MITAEFQKSLEEDNSKLIQKIYNNEESVDVTKEQIEFLKNSGLEIKKVGNKQYCKNTLLSLIPNEKNSERRLFDIARRVEMRQTAKKRWFNGNKL